MGSQTTAAAVAAQCMLVLELSRLVPEWNQWLAYDVLYIRYGKSAQAALLAVDWLGWNGLEWDGLHCLLAVCRIHDGRSPARNCLLFPPPSLSCRCAARRV